MKQKIKSYGFWTALSGAVVVLLEALGKAFGFSVNNDVVSSIIMAIAGVLVVFGVVSMPNKDKDNSETEEKQENEQDKEKGE